MIGAIAAVPGSVGGGHERNDVSNRRAQLDTYHLRIAPAPGCCVVVVGFDAEVIRQC